MTREDLEKLQIIINRQISSEVAAGRLTQEQASTLRAVYNVNALVSQAEANLQERKSQIKRFLHIFPDDLIGEY